MPRPLGLACKWAMVHPRYWRQIAAARSGYREHGGKYPHPVLFIAGLPKSGTTWLEQMVAGFPGYCEVLPPEVTFAELKGEAGHIHQLQPGVLDRFERALVLTKMHIPGTPGNVAALKKAGVPCVVLYRDPRDVAVSYVHYVRETPWHQDHPALKQAEMGEALRFFLRERLPEFARWMRGWRDHRDPATSLMLSYEELLGDAEDALRRIAALFGLEADEATLRDIVERNRFERLQGTGGGFFRKGVAGDWRNHFDEALRREFVAVDGALLVEFGYEKDHAW